MPSPLTPSNRNLDNVLIVGGGIGGLTVAIALQQAGFNCTVFEQVPKLAEAGAGITLWENALKVYGSLGLRQKLIQRGVLLDDGIVGTSTGRALNQMRLTDLRAIGEQIDVLGIHRAALQAVLVAAARPSNVRLGHRLVAIQDDGDVVHAQFENGETASGDLLIGADGIHSTVRKLVLGPHTPRFTGQTCWRGVCPRIEGWRGATGEFWGRGKRFGVIAIDAERLYWYAAINAPANMTPPNGDAKSHLLNLFADWKHQVPEIIAETQPRGIRHNDLIDCAPTAGWSKGRVTLLGDAIHSTTPNMGQGACMAIESACVLTQLLSSTENLETALAKYEAIRSPRTSWVTRRSWTIGKIAQWHNPVACWLRNLVTGLTPPSFLIKHAPQLLLHDVTEPVSLICEQ